MDANQPPPRRPGRPRTSQNAGTARGELAGWLRDVAAREPSVSNGKIAAHAGVTSAAVGRAMRGETFASSQIVSAVVSMGNLTDDERAGYSEWVAALAVIDAQHGRTPAGEIPAPPWRAPSGESAPRAKRRRPLIVVAATSVGLLVLVVVLVAVYRPGLPTKTRAEQVANRSGATTFADPVHGAGSTGPKIPAFAIVEVSCKVYSPIFPSVTPDGYWYRIASSPWNDQFYAVANIFANGDPPGSATVTNTDTAVPDC